MASPAEDAAMLRAVSLAARGLGTTSPNPVVGCVILDAAGNVVGEGFHAYAGGPHAEVGALAAAGERARGGTAVVTLEPCNHTGRTGPCTEALIAGRRGPGGGRRGRPQPGRHRRRASRCARPGSTSRSACAPTRCGPATWPGSPRPDEPPPATRGRSSSGSSRPRWTVGPRRWTAPANGSPPRTRGPTCRTAVHRGRHHGRASAPCWPTTRT